MVRVGSPSHATGGTVVEVDDVDDDVNVVVVAAALVEVVGISVVVVVAGDSLEVVGISVAVVVVLVVAGGSVVEVVGGATIPMHSASQAPWSGGSHSSPASTIRSPQPADRQLVRQASGVVSEFAAP